jgi:uncharacterized membrane protein
MITYKPYHYRLIYVCAHLLVVGASLYFLTIDNYPQPIAFACMGWSAACIMWGVSKYRHEKRSWRSVERIMEYARESGD